MKFRIDLIFPMLLIILNVCACIASLCSKDYWRSLYWIAAAVLNTTVIFMG